MNTSTDLSAKTVSSKKNCPAELIDLHVHSTASDGTLTPAKLVWEAKKQGLKAFALTDHDTISGISEARMAASDLKEKGYCLELIPGIEISAAYGKGDIHILGLFIDETLGFFKEGLDKIKKDREERNAKMVENLAAAGLPISMEALTAEYPQAVLTRAHFAKYLLKKGVVKDIKSAFSKYLGESGPYYVPRKYMAPEDAIKLIKKAGGIPILAHPLLYHLPDSKLKQLIHSLKEQGLMGLEAIHSTNMGNDESYLRGLASQYGLSISGGSDFHGVVKPDIQLGIGRGNLSIPYSILENLKQLKEKQ